MAQLFGIRSKLLLSFLAVGILGIAGIGIGSFYITKNYLQAEAFDQLTALREVKQQQIEAYFDQVRGQVANFSKDFMTIDAMRQFNTTFFTVEQDDQYTPEQLKQMSENLKKFYAEKYLPKLNANLDEKVQLGQFFEDMKNETVILQNLYIVDNPYPKKRIDYDRAPDKSNYTKIHAKYNPIFREYLKAFEYYDLFLIDAKTGYVVYNASKEIDFASNITKGPFKQTNVAQGFFEVQQATDKDFVKFLDFQFYIPSQGMPSAFVMAPIYDGDKKIGVLALQLNIEEINKIMTNDKKWKQTGLGDTGESYIIGDDYKMRSDSRFLIQNPDKYYKDLAAVEVNNNIIEKMRLLNTTILIQDIVTESAQEVMRGNSDTRIIIDYRGVPNISSYTPLNIKDSQWGIIAEMDHRELLDKVQSFGLRLLALGLLALIVIMLLSFILIHFLLRPLYAVLSGLHLVNRDNHLNIRERMDVGGKDVIAQINQQVNAILAELQKGLNAIMQAKKEITSQAGKMADGVQRSITAVDLIVDGEKSGKEQLDQVARIAMDLKKMPATHGAFTQKVQQFSDSMQVACTTINRVINSAKEYAAKEGDSSIRTQLDEASAAEQSVKGDLGLLSDAVNAFQEQSHNAEQHMVQLNEAISAVSIIGKDALSDGKKLHKALDQVNAQLEKIKQALSEFEKTARTLTV